MVWCSQPRVLKRPFHSTSLPIQPLHARAAVGQQDNSVLGLVDRHAIFLLQDLQVLHDCATDDCLPHKAAVRGAPCGDAVAYSADDGVLVDARSQEPLAAGRRAKVLPPYQRTVLRVNCADGLILRDGVQEGRFGAGIGLLEESGLVSRQAQQRIMEVNVVCIVLEDCCCGSETCCKGQCSMKTHGAVGLQAFSKLRCLFHACYGRAAHSMPRPAAGPTQPPTQPPA